jgi:hypothetical protein
MMQVEIIEQFVDRKLVDVGIKSDFEEQAVRLLLFHLCIAIDIYRHMTQAEKNKSGYWYREELKNSFSLTGFLKERKRKRDKKKSPLHPSYKEESGVKEKAQSSLPPLSKKEFKESDQKEGFKERQQAFWAELEPFCKDCGGKYDRQMVLKFFYYWAQEVKKTGTMRWENETAWTTEFALAGWSKKPFETYAQAANIRLERTKGKKSAKAAVNTQELQAVAAKRAEDNEKLEREIAERKAGAVPYEEYIRQKENKE